VSQAFNKNPNLNPREFLKKLISGGGAKFAILFWIVVIIWAVTSSFYTVEADSVAVVQRFGRYTSSEEPGLHMRIPFGIDTITKVPVRRQLKLEFGFGTSHASNPYQNSQEPEKERDQVTGDLNAAQVEWVVQYRIADAREYCFTVQDPEDTLRAASETIMREVIGDRTIDEVITFGRQEIETENLIRLGKLAKEYRLGVLVDLVQLKNINPPPAVQASFNDVNAAQQEKQRRINEASGEYNKVIPRARGEAARVIAEANGYAQKRINEATGDADFFNAFLAEYLKAPEVTHKRIYLETMGEVLPKFGSKLVMDEQLNKLFPYLPSGETTIKKK